MTELRCYCSGMSSITDFSGVADAGLPVGVQVHHISSTVEGAITRYTAEGGFVFVDSGAFRCFTKGEAVDFAEVLGRYRRLAANTTKPENLALVAPDVIGNMDATAALQRRHLTEVRNLASMGAEILVPFQRGWETPQYIDHYGRLEKEIGPFTLAFACNAAAWRGSDIAKLVARLQPKRVHLLGVGNKNLDAYTDAVSWNSPDTIISSDANRTRAFIGEGRAITEDTRKGLDEVYREAEADFDICYDPTELDYDLHNTPGYLEPCEAMELALLFGVAGETVKEWGRASQEQPDEALVAERDEDGEGIFGCRLGYLIEESDPYGYYCQTLVHAHNGESIKEMLARLAVERKRSEVRRRVISGVVLLDDRRRQAAYRTRRSQMLLFAAQEVAKTGT